MSVVVETLACALTMAALVLLDVAKLRIYPRNNRDRIHWWAIRYYGFIIIHSLEAKKSFTLGWPHRWSSPR